MEGQIESLYAKQAEEQLAKIKAELSNQLALVKELNKNKISFSNGKTAGTATEFKAVLKQIAEQEKAMKKIEAQNARLIEQLRTRQRLEEDTIARRNAKEAAAEQRRAAREAAAQGMYAQTDAKLKELSKTYDNLAIKKQLGEKLTDAEEKQLTQLTAEIQRYDQALKAVDAAKGKYTRNVGNYSSAFDGLGGSINQLTREMPAFANSVQTGFMAISNNLPIFFDAMQQAIAQQKELQAQGKPSKNALQLLAGSLFTFGTALSVGVTLLTVFGPKLWEMVSGSKAKKAALEAEKKALEEKTAAEKAAFEQQAKYASDEIAKSKTLFETARNVNVSYKERVAAVNELQTRYPDYLGNLSQEKILAGETAEAELKLNDALMKRAMFLATQELIIKETQNLVKLMMSQSKGQADLNNLYDVEQEKLNAGTKAKNKYRLATEADLQSTKGLEATLQNNTGAIELNYTTMSKQELVIRKKLDSLYKILNRYQGFNKVVNDNTKATTAANKAEEIKRQILKNTEEDLQNQINKIQEVRNRTADTTKEYKDFTWQIEQLEFQLRLLRGEFDKNTESSEDFEAELQKISDNVEKFHAKNKEIAKESPFKNYFQGFIDAFGEQSGFSQVIKILSGQIDGFGKDAKVTALAVSEAFQEAFNTIQGNSAATFEAERAQLDKQKEMQLVFAGDSAAARERIEEQYQRKQDAIRRRQAKAERDLALFNIFLNTAQAVVAALPNIPLSITIGAIGAVQLALASARPIPQFKEGLKAGTHKGGLLMMNDGDGANFRETLVTPSGQIYQPSGRNEIVDAPKGTLVYTADQWKQASKVGAMTERKGGALYVGLSDSTYMKGVRQITSTMERGNGGQSKRSVILHRRAQIERIEEMRKRKNNG